MNNEQLLDAPPLQPAQDPPTFEPAEVRQCINSTGYVEGRDDGPHRILIPTTVSISVAERLGINVQIPNNNNDDDDGRGVNDDGDVGGEMDYGDDVSLIDSSSSESSDASSWEDEMQEDFETNQMQNNVAPSQSSPMKAFRFTGFLLGQGTHGGYDIHIHHAKVLQKAPINWRETGEEVAIKTIRWEVIRACRNRLHEDFIKEIEALQYISEWHKREGRAHMDTHVLAADTVMSDELNLYIVMPCCIERDLYYKVEDAIQRRRGEKISKALTEDESRDWFIQILQGLETLQRMQICHRDLSPENLVILNNRTLVIDFGMCLRIPYSSDGVHCRHLIRRRTPCGKLPYVSPEIHGQVDFDGHAVDIWAAGTILLFMLTGQRLLGPPYTDGAFDSLNLGISDEAMDLLSRMFRVDPVNRLSLSQIRQHPFVLGNFE